MARNIPEMLYNYIRKNQTKMLGNPEFHLDQFCHKYKLDDFERFMAHYAFEHLMYPEYVLRDYSIDFLQGEYDKMKSAKRLYIKFAEKERLVYNNYVANAEYYNLQLLVDGELVYFTPRIKIESFLYKLLEYAPEDMWDVPDSD